MAVFPVRRIFLLATALVTFFLVFRSLFAAPDGAASSLTEDDSHNVHRAGRVAATAPAKTTSTASAGGDAATADQLSAKSRKPAWSIRGSDRRYRSQQQQASLIDPTQLPLRDQLALQFPYDADAPKFPAYIWQTWKSSPASSVFEQELRPAEASWTELHPSFVHEVITDETALLLVRYLFASVPQVVAAYEALPLPVLRADFFRYCVLLARGGIYSDIDTAALKSAADWVPADVPRARYGLVVGIEADPDRADWQQWYSRRIQFCQWTIQAKPGHPVLADIVATIAADTLTRQAQGRLRHFQSRDTLEFTGPGVWTDALFRYFNDPAYFDTAHSPGNVTWRNFTGMDAHKRIGDVVILPITSFSPGVRQMGAGEDDDPMAFVKHYFSGSWKPESERHIGEVNIA